MYYSYSLLVLLSHFTGLNESFGGRIYCSQVTCDLLLLRFPALSSRVSALELDVPHVLYSDVDGTSFTVTLYDANHCPGSAMFLFHGDFGTVLYTGDFRYDEVEMKAAFGSLVGQIDRVVIDATFGRPSMRFPSKSQSCNMLVDLIQTLLPSARRVLLPFKLGDEELVVQLCRRLKTKICLDQSHPAALERSQQWSLLESVRPYLTDDSTITKLRVAQPRGQIVCQPGDVVVKASTQWFLQNVQNAIASSNDVLLKPVKDEFNQYHVFYSMHSGTLSFCPSLANLGTCLI
jgi:predicted metal-dependent RNase